MNRKKQNIGHKVFKTLTVFILLSVSTLGFLQMFFSNSLATSGERLRALEEEKQRLETENELLSNTIVEYSALSRISSESARLGMVRASSYLYTTIPTSLAMGGN